MALRLAEARRTHDAVIEDDSTRASRKPSSQPFHGVRVAERRLIDAPSANVGWPRLTPHDASPGL